jgi:hypothetical protein
MVARSGIRATAGLSNFEICERRACSSASQRYERSEDFSSWTGGRSEGGCALGLREMWEEGKGFHPRCA